MTMTSPRPAVVQESPRLYRFTYDQYYQLADLGFFRDQRVELIDGEILDMAPQKDLHTAAILLVQHALQRALPALLIRTQMPLHLAPNSQPEPDISVVSGTIRDYVGTGHPKSALLVVEVADATLLFDRTKKTSLYASARIPDYWIVNIQDKCIEIYRDPIADPSAPFSFRYKTVTTLKPPESLSPLPHPAAQIPIADLLP